MGEYKAYVIFCANHELERVKLGVTSDIARYLRQFTIDVGSKETQCVLAMYCPNDAEKVRDYLRDSLDSYQYDVFNRRHRGIRKPVGWFSIGRDFRRIVEPILAEPSIAPLICSRKWYIKNIENVQDELLEDAGLTLLKSTIDSTSDCESDDDNTRQRGPAKSYRDTLLKSIAAPRTRSHKFYYSVA